MWVVVVVIKPGIDVKGFISCSSLFKKGYFPSKVNLSYDNSCRSTKAEVQRHQAHHPISQNPLVHERVLASFLSVITKKQEASDLGMGISAVRQVKTSIDIFCPTFLYMRAPF